MKTATRIAFASTFAIAAGAMLAFQQAGTSPLDDGARRADPTLRTLRARMDLMQEQMDELQSRVFMLEDRVFEGGIAVEATEDTETGEVAVSAPGRLLKLESIEQAPVDSAKLEEADELLEEAAEWEDKAERLQDRIAHERSDDYEGRGGGGDGTRELGSLLATYRRKARQLRGEGLRLQREANEPKQIIKGWNGDRTVVLKSTKNIAPMLESVRAGEFLTWDGRRTYLSDAIVRYEVTRVQETLKPEDFTPRGDSATDDASSSS